MLQILRRSGPPPTKAVCAAVEEG